MKRLPRPLPNFSALLLLSLGATASAAAALVPAEWRHRQEFAVAAPGLVRVDLPAATFDAAQPGLADLRLLDPAGRETAYFLDRTRIAAADEVPRAITPRAFHAVPGHGSTQLIIETGTTAELDFLALETSAPYFLKAAHGEVSADGLVWRSLGPAIPLFRQFGAEQLRVALGRNRAAFIRLTLDDARSGPVTFSQVRLQPAPVQAAPPLLAFGARITRRDEFAGETVLTVQLDGRHAPLAALSLETDEPLFMRRVTVTVREMQGDVPGERTIATGTLYRLRLEGAPVREQLQLPLNFSPATRELLVHIHHADSPPIALTGVAAWQYPVSLLFHAAGAGGHTLLSGHPRVAAPRYDLAAFAADLRAADATLVTPGPLQDTPDHLAPSEPLLPDVPLVGAPLDTRDWTRRKAVELAAPGVHELELDPAALAGARSDFADLRLLRADNQIPYLLERPALARSLTLTPEPAPDAKRPAVSVWRVKLPHAGLPLRRVILASDTTLFQRQFRLYEKVTASDGRVYEHTLATGAWSRTPEPGSPRTRLFDLGDRLQTDTLYLETDNGDNPPIALAGVKAEHAVVRLVFKTAETDGFQLIYGHPAAAAPRYDLSLVAVKLLTASRTPAGLGTEETDPEGFARGALRHLKGGVAFWGALALVVVVLLVVVARLLPKPEAAK